MKRNYARILALTLALLIAMPSMLFATANTNAVSGVEATALADPVGNESFQKNLEAFPALWDEGEGTTQSVFNFANRIVEEVFVEIPLDTDGNGTRDLLKVVIYRPGESNQPGVTVPVLLHHSPYIHGTHNVDNLDFVVELSDTNPDTTHYTYEDVETQQIQAYEWPWTDEAFVINDPTMGTITVPASRGDKPNTSGITGNPILTANPSSAPSATNWKGYLLTRGYAYAISGNLGVRYADGIPSSCDVDEAVAAMAVIKWFAGEARGYADKEGTIQVTAESWCNGNVAMEGTSYPGTTPLLAAGTGVANLKAIFPKAAVSNWYNYYRENGAVHNPDLYSGEDAVKHSEFNFSNYDYITTAVKALAEAKFATMLARAERETGSYNEFWDQRNLMKNLEMLQKGREDDPIGVIIQHGFNDHNVKTRMSDQLYRAIKEYAPDTPVKIVWHNGIHTDTQIYGGLLEWTHKWLDHFLYGIDNNVVEDMPDTLVESNITGKYEAYDSWPVPGAEYQTLYFNPAAAGAGAGTFGVNAPDGNVTASFVDDLVNYTTDVNQVGGGSYQAYVAAWERRALLSWDNDKPNLDTPNTNRLAFVSEPLTEDLRMSGTAIITLDIAADKAKGYISAAIVEIGTNARPYAHGDSNGRAGTYGGISYPAVPTANALGSGTRIELISDAASGSKVVTYDGHAINPATTSEYKFVARAMANVRKPNPSGKTYLDAADTYFIPEYYYQEKNVTPGEYNTYTFEFEPQDYTFKAGQQLAVIIFSTDYRHSDIAHDVTTLTMDHTDSYIRIPFVNATLDDIDLGIKLDIENDDKIKAGDTVTINASLNKETNSNTAILDFVYDKTKFDFDSFVLPANVTELGKNETTDGYRLIIMKNEYEMKELAKLNLVAKANITDGIDGMINLGAQVVVKDENGDKTTVILTSNFDYTPPTDPVDPGTDPGHNLGEITLIVLSDAIDAFGKSSLDANWAQYRKYDLNKNGSVDIADIAKIASFL